MKVKALLISASVLTIATLVMAQVPGVNSNFPTTFNIPLDNHRATYSAQAAFVPPAAATDIYMVCGSATRSIFITRLSIAGRGSAVQPFGISLVLRSSTASGGTQTTITPTKYDSNYPTATGSAKLITTNVTTLGTFTGTLITDQYSISNLTTGVGSAPLIYFFGNRPASALTLRGTGQCLTVNLNGATITTPVFDINAEWTEQPL